MHKEKQDTLLIYLNSLFQTVLSFHIIAFKKKHGFNKALMASL
jgi:hypothetical protein